MNSALKRTIFWVVFSWIIAYVGLLFGSTDVIRAMMIGVMAVPVGLALVGFMDLDKGDPDE